MLNTNESEDRMPSAAGRFYPASATVLLSEVKSLLSEYAACAKYENVRAIIVPHAGYIFSGRVAASAYASIPSEKVFENIILIGSSHRTSFHGASVYNKGDYITPLGKVKVNRNSADILIDESEFISFRREAHQGEHSLEVQLPFIQCHFKVQPQIIPVIAGTGDIKVIKAVARSLEPLFRPENLFVISTDFSHYPSLADANRIDSETAEAVITGDPASLLKTVIKHGNEEISGLATSMCGINAALILMHITESSDNYIFRHIKYMNSGESPLGDKDRVVGYHSFLVTEGNRKELTYTGNTLSYPISSEDGRYLISIARRSIESGLEGRYKPLLPVNIPDSLRIRSGAFVSLHAGKKLRGCIGRLAASEQLCMLVADMAYSAAFEDSRFNPLSGKEYEEISIEISVVSPMRKISDIGEIEIGKHGICLRQGGRSGVLLPQVAVERGWSVIEFLEHTADRKAGIGKEGWKDAEILIFEAYIIRESDFDEQ